MFRNIAGWLQVNRIDHVNAAAGAAGFITNIFGSAVQVASGRLVSGGLLVFQRPGCLGSINLFEIGDTGTLLTGGAGFDKVGNRNRGQQTNNGHYDHDFHQGESCFVGFVYLHRFFYFSGVNEVKGGLIIV